jgi:tricorn protease
MPSGYYRYPTLHQDQVVFVCEDDLWTVPASGGVARRLTSNLGEVSRPSLSNDGSQLAFIGREEGHAEVYVMPAQGGLTRRLTFMGGTLCATAGWSADGKIIFSNNAGHWYLRYTHLYTVLPDGGEVEQLPFGLARAVAFGPAGGVVLGRNTDDPARWKRYRGGTTGQLWVDESGEGQFHPLLKLAGNLGSPMWLPVGEPGGRIFFIADHEGIGNLYSCLPSGADLRRHSDHADFYARNASTDGRRIVYHAGAELYLYDPLADSTSRIELQFHSPQTQRNRKFVDAARYLTHWSLHPNGQAVAIATRGQIFTFANWEAAVTHHELAHVKPDDEAEDDASRPAVRARLPHWLNDGKRLVAVSDALGEEHFVVWKADGSDQPDYFTDLDIGRPVALAVNPHKDQLLFSNHRYELLCLDLEDRTLTLIDRGKAQPIGGFAWSPGGEWAVYSVSISAQRTALKLWNGVSGEITQLTEPVLHDIAPAFDPRGRFIYFLSYRVFEPVYDKLQFDLSFPRAMKPYLITLQKDMLTPFIPQPRVDLDLEEEDKDKEPESKDGEQPASQEAPEAAAASPGEPASTGADQPAAGDTDQAKQKPESKQEDDEEEKKLEIDLEGIQRRVIAFPVPEGTYGRILGSADGKVLYTRHPLENAVDVNPVEEHHNGPGTLLSYNFEDQKEDTLFTGVADFDLSRNARWLIYSTGTRLRVVKVGDKPTEEREAPSRKNGWLDLSRVKVSVMPGAEWRQMLREAWRLQREHFWTSDMAEIDWLAVYERYLPLVDRVSSRSEFSDLIWEMQGELGTSHAYEFGGDYRPEPNYHQGFLGADFAFDPGRNGWKVTHIYLGDAWEPSSDSPLAKPGVNVKEGDLILAINGQKLTRKRSPASALVNQAGEDVALTILSPEEEKPHQVNVRLLYNESSARYREWVESCRQRVHAATGGRVGYLHIPDMMGAGFAEFHRGYLSEVERQGLIVDVRFNRGGHVSALLLEKLARRRIGYDIARWSQELFPYPPESVLGPMVALTNEHAGSDGDIFSHGFKLMNLGPLVGKRTWGGVVGIEPRHNLIDGTVTTQPEFSFWFMDVGWGVENYGTDPDIEVDIAPQDYAHGVDTQLERGIEEILKLLEANPPRLPELPPRPSRALPRLPAR